MVEREVVEYIRKNLRRGLSPQRIRQGLLAQGKSDYDISEGFKEAKSERREESVSSSRNEKSFFESKSFKKIVLALILVILFILVYVLVF